MAVGRAVVAAFLLLGASAPAAAVKKKPAAPGAHRLLDRKKPIHVTSRRLSVFNKEHRAVFVGNVVARQGDLTLRCDRLTARSQPRGGLTSIVATGHIRLRKADRRAVGKRLEYDHRKRVMVLTGAPKLWQKDSYLTGARVVFYLDQDRVEVEAAKGRLRLEDHK